LLFFASGGHEIWETGGVCLVLGLDQLHYSYIHYKKAIVTARDISPWDESGNSLGCYLKFKVGMQYGKHVVFTNSFIQPPCNWLKSNNNSPGCYTLE
jgi:hypothetical protein